MTIGANTDHDRSPSRYFYHRRKGPCRGMDSTGVECHDVGEAAAQAYVELLQWMECSAQRQGSPLSVEVTDEDGRTIFRLPSAAVISAIG